VPFPLSAEAVPAAVEKIGRKTPIAASLSADQWAGVPLALRERAFFVSRVESIRYVAEAKRMLGQMVEGEREKIINVNTGKPDTVLRTPDLFARRMKQLVAESGMDPRTGRRGIQDVSSNARLNLIAQMQEQQAYGFARWKGDQDPDMLDAFPCWEFTRTEPRDEPREDWPERWAAAGGKTYGGRMIARKDDPVWTKLSRFGTPWPPFDYGSGMGVDDVTREEAEALGVIARDEKVASGEQAFNDELEASVADLGEWGRKALEVQFGDQVRFEGDRAVWRGNLIRDLVQRVIDHGLDRPFDNKAFSGQRIDLGVIPKSAQAKASAAGVKLDGARMLMTPDRLHHMLERHGPGRETRGDQQPLTRTDVELIPHIWRDPDTVAQDRDGVRFEKRISGRVQMVLFEPYGQGNFLPASVRVKKE
jgi:hypothetical protein